MDPITKLRLRLAATGFVLFSVAVGTYYNSVRALKPDPFLDAQPSKSIVSKSS